MGLEKTFSSFKETFKGKNGTKAVTAIFIIGLFGVALLALPRFFDNPVKTEAVAEEKRMIAGDEYLNTEVLEERLVRLVEGIAGAGSAQAMVTLQNGAEYVYATEVSEGESKSNDGTRATSQSDTKEKLILVSQSGGGQAPVVLKKVPATVLGVAILCDGADNSQVRLNIIEAVTTLLNISSNRVCIMKKS